VVTGLKHQKEKRSLDHFAGLDVSVKDTSVCIVDDTGKIIRAAVTGFAPCRNTVSVKQRVSIPLSAQ